MQSRRWIWLGVFPAAVYSYYQLTAPGSISASVMHYVLQFFFLFFATVSTGSVSMRDENPKTARFWGLLTVGLGIWCLTTVLELLEIQLKQPTYGTVADGFWIAGYLPMLAGMQAGAALFGGYRTPTALRAGMFWLAFAALVLAAILVFTKPDAGSTLLLILACFYHVSDVLLTFWALLAVYGKDSGTLRDPLRFILSACVLIYAFNLVVMLQQFTAPIHTWSAAVFSVAYLLFYIAGRHAALSCYAQGSVIR